MVERSCACITPSLQGGAAQKKKSLGGPSHGGKARVVSEHPVSPAVQDASKESCLSPEAPRALKQELHNWEAGGGRKEIGKEANKNIREH